MVVDGAVVSKESINALFSGRKGSQAIKCTTIRRGEFARVQSLKLITHQCRSMDSVIANAMSLKGPTFDATLKNVTLTLEVPTFSAFLLA